MNKLVTYLKSVPSSLAPYKKTLIIVAVSVVVLVGVYSAGRLSAPTKVVTVDKTQTVDINKDLVKEMENLKVAIQKLTDEQINLKLHIERTTTKNADGSSIVKEIEDKNVDTVIHTKEVDTKVQVVTVDKIQIQYQDRIVEKDKLVERDLPQWGVQGLLGANLSFPGGLQLISGGQIDHRLPGFLKSFSAGAFGMGGGARGAIGGVVLRLEF